MKIAQRAKQCELSPMRKFHPYAEKAEAMGRKVYHLNIGQPDIATPPVFFEAISNFKQPVLAYASAPGRPEFVKAVRDYYEKMGIHYEASDILVTAGGSEAINIAMMCILDPGSEVLVAEPFYPNYNTFVRAGSGRIRPIPTSPEEGYRFATREKIEPLINENTRAIMITSPSNPTGIVLTREEFRLIADIAKENDLYIIGDEVYREYIFSDEPPTSFGEFEDVEQNVILIDSVSKRFSACGARVGCLISKNKEFMAEALKFCQARLCVATLDQVASAALYSVDEAYFEEMRKEYKRRRDTVLEKLSKIPGVVYSQPDGAFYIMAALPIDDAEEFQKWLMTDFEDNGDTVMFAPARSFYQTPGKGINEIRIAYVLKQQDLERAMDLLALGIEAYNNRNK